MIIATSGQLFGPYQKYEILSDRIRVWPVNTNPNGPGADLPFSVIGDYEVIDPALPDGFDVDRYLWVGGQLVLKE